MTRLGRRFLTPVLFLAIAVAVGAAIDHALAGTDVIAALLAHRGVVVALGLVARFAVRVFVAVVAPTWLLYLAASAAFERRSPAQRRAG